MDQLGLLHQFLPPEILPLQPSMRVIGRAMTVLKADRQDGDPAAPPFGRLFEAHDYLKRNEVYVCSGGSPEYALGPSRQPSWRRTPGGELRLETTSTSMGAL